MEQHNVILLFFDLPVMTKEDRRNYNKFHKGLLRAGYLPVQKSVYAKLLRNGRTTGSELAALCAIAPKDSKVSALPMTLAQFKRMTAISGEDFNFSLFSDDLLFIRA